MAHRLLLLMGVTMFVYMATSESMFRKLFNFENGNVYNSTATFLTKSVTTNSECGMTCHALGEDRCQSFNLIPEGEKIRCEIFDHQPIRCDTIVYHPDGQLYERYCKPLLVTASVSERLIGSNGTLLTLVDEKRTVYHVTQTHGLQTIGQFENIFQGYGATNRVDDLMQFTLEPFNDTHLVRSGRIADCYLPISTEHKRFVRCSGEHFPIDFHSVDPRMGQNASIRVVTNDGIGTIVTLWGDILVVSYNDGGVQGKVLQEVLQGQKQKKYFPDVPGEGAYNDTFRYWKAASSAMHIRGSLYGLFADWKFYVYDISTQDVLERYSMCIERYPYFLF